jgi:iron complex transport system substrate-binding protein
MVLTACEQKVEDLKELSVIDAYGRTVYYKEDSNRFLCLGTGVLRLYSYVADINEIVGIEQIENDWGSKGRPYHYLFENKDYMIVGNGGVGATLDKEKILVANPDVIFISDFYDIDTIENLQNELNIPVVTVSYNDVAGNIFNELLYQSLLNIGTVTNHLERSEEVVTYMKDIKQDLINRTSNKESESTIYLGAQAYKGKHGIESSSGDFKIFDILGLNNIVSLNGFDTHVMLEKEVLLEWNPDVIIIDANGYQLVQDDIALNKEYYNALGAFASKEVYLQMPYNYYSTNIEISLANAYYIGSVMYSEAFDDINIEDKFDEISMFFLGLETYHQVSADYYGGYQVITLD